MWNGGGENFVFSEDEDKDKEDSDEDDDIEKLFPADVVGVLKTNHLLSKMFEFNDNAEDDKNPIKVSDLIEATTTLQNAVSLLKIDINNREPSWKVLYTKNIKSARKQFADYGTKSCRGESCIGLPTKTQIFWQAAFPLCLHIYRENGKLKFFLH